MIKLNEADWRINASINLATIGSDNGLLIGIKPSSEPMTAYGFRTNFNEIWKHTRQITLIYVNSLLWLPMRYLPCLLHQIPRDFAHDSGQVGWCILRMLTCTIRTSGSAESNISRLQRWSHVILFKFSPPPLLQWIPPHANAPVSDHIDLLSLRSRFRLENL